MKFIGTILTPGGQAYEVLADAEMGANDLAHFNAELANLADGLKAGKVAFFVGGRYRLRPVSGMFGPVTDEERAELERRASPYVNRRPFTAPAGVEVTR